MHLIREFVQTGAWWNFANFEQGLFIGFSFFNAGTSQQELQNQMFSIFMVFLLFGNLLQQILPNFVVQRALYEVRERPAKTFSWKAFMFSNIIVELPWNTLMAVFVYFTFYYPVGLYKNAEPTDAVHERGALFFLTMLAFFLFTSTFANMIIAGMDSKPSPGVFLKRIKEANLCRSSRRDGRKYWTATILAHPHLLRVNDANAAIESRADYCDTVCLPRRRPCRDSGSSCTGYRRSHTLSAPCCPRPLPTTKSYVPPTRYATSAHHPVKPARSTWHLTSTSPGAT